MFHNIKSVTNLVRHDEAVSVGIGRLPRDVGFATRYLRNDRSAGFRRNVAETNSAATGHVTDAVASGHAVDTDVVGPSALDGQGRLAVLRLADLDAAA